MKLVYEKMDEEHLEAARRNILYGDIPPGYPIKEKKTYFIPFDVLDIAKANVFVNNFVHDNLYPRVKETEYLTGVRFGRVTCSKKDLKISLLKKALKRCLDELNRIQ